MAQTAKASRDVERDVVVRLPTGEPRPGAVGQLHFRQLAQRSVGFVIEPVIVEKYSHVPARLAFALGLPQPRRFLDGDRFEVLVFLERTVQGRSVAPLLEDAM